ncbi:MAG: flavin reductase family protein [Muribaculaceae bacterium]|nr:flavin reductase family protein [Muribaculaceae bacterium]
MNVAWGGQCWDDEIALNISSDHKTTENMRKSGAFTVHIADEERVELADYFGIVSGPAVAKAFGAGRALK